MNSKVPAQRARWHMYRGRVQRTIDPSDLRAISRVSHVDVALPVAVHEVPVLDPVPGEKNKRKAAKEEVVAAGCSKRPHLTKKKRYRYI